MGYPKVDLKGFSYIILLFDVSMQYSSLLCDLLPYDISSLALSKASIAHA